MSDEQHIDTAGPNAGGAARTASGATFHCSSCGHSQSLPAAFAGRQAKCPKCGKTLALFKPPPQEFDKKGELYKLTLELRAGQIEKEAFAQYLQGENGKLSNARSKVRDGDEPLLEEAFGCWETALQQAANWLRKRAPMAG